MRGPYPMLPVPDTLRPYVIHQPVLCLFPRHPLVQLKALGIDNIMRFEWLSPPPAEAMVRALEVLAALGVLDEDAK